MSELQQIKNMLQFVIEDRQRLYKEIGSLKSMVAELQPVEYISEKEASRITGIPPSTLRKWRMYKGMPYEQPTGENGKVLIPKKQFLDWLKSFDAGLIRRRAQA